MSWVVDQDTAAGSLWDDQWVVKRSVGSVGEGVVELEALFGDGASAMISRWGACSWDR